MANDPMRHNTAGTPRDGQPLGTHFPPTKDEVVQPTRPHLVEGASAYEREMGEESDPDGLRTPGHFEVPLNDDDNEGFVPPTTPGGGWERVSDRAPEESFEEVEPEEG